MRVHLLAAALALVSLTPGCITLITYNATVKNAEPNVYRGKIEALTLVRNSGQRLEAHFRIEFEDGIVQHYAAGLQGLGVGPVDGPVPPSTEKFSVVFRESPDFLAVGATIRRGEAEGTLGPPTPAMLQDLERPIVVLGGMKRDQLDLASSCSVRIVEPLVDRGKTTRVFALEQGEEVIAATIDWRFGRLVPQLTVGRPNEPQRHIEWTDLETVEVSAASAPLPNPAVPIVVTEALADLVEGSTVRRVGHSGAVESSAANFTETDTLRDALLELRRDEATGVLRARWRIPVAQPLEVEVCGWLRPRHETSVTEVVAGIGFAFLAPITVPLDVALFPVEVVVVLYILSHEVP